MSDARGMALPGQLRMSFARWALVTVPGIVFLGFLSGRAANSGEGNRWFAMLDKPAAMPPGWVFGGTWTVLYILMGVALAMILNARGARWRRAAIVAFAVQLALNLAWSPLFFAAHRVVAAFWLILAILVAAVVTTVVFGRVRRGAAWLMVPYLAWLAFAAILNWQVHALNPGAATLVPTPPRTHIAL